MDDTKLPDDATNVLVLSETGDDAISAAAAHPARSARYLVVSYTRSVEECASGIRESAGAPPTAIAVILAHQGEGSDGRADVSVSREAPENLTGIGVRANEILTKWRALDEPIVIAFDSISALLQYADSKPAFRFLHAFTDRVQHADATAFYHLSARAHDESTLATFRQLFDTVLERDDDGELRVTWRR